MTAYRIEPHSGHFAVIEDPSDVVIEEGLSWREATELAEHLQEEREHDHAREWWDSEVGHGRR